MMTKRIVIFLLLIILCIFFIACQKNNFSNDMVTDHSSANDTEEDYSNDAGGEIATIAIESYKDYLKFIDKNEMPEDFIYYESLKEYGKFDSFVYSESYNEYIYSFVDSEGFETFLKIEPIEAYNYDSKGDVLNDFNANDLRTIGYKESAKILKNGYEYQYFSGELLEIQWEIDGKRFELSANGEFDNYPVTTDTAVGKLLFNLDSDAVVQ